MRYLSIPEELALPHLLELDSMTSVLRTTFRTGYDQLYQGRYEAAARSAQRVIKAAESRYTVSLGQLFHAEVLRRIGRLQDALDTVKRALRWLELQVSFKAHYNEAVAVYLKGCLHYILCAEEDALHAFAYAQYELGDSVSSWQIERRSGRVEDCRNLRRWMEQLVRLQTSFGAETTFILPVYELRDHHMIRTDVVLVCPFQAPIPAELLKEYLPDRYVPIMNQTVSFFSPEPQVTYLAIRSLRDDDIFEGARKGGLYIFEVANPVVVGTDIGLTVDRTFVRVEEGQIAFRPVKDGHEFRGILRLLIREDSEL